jgi:hypothetical protein
MVASNSADQVINTLPVANGGTGVTSSTGSGSNVLSNSPTINSPTIGNAGGAYPGQANFSVGAIGGGGQVQISAPSTQSTNTYLGLPVITTTTDTLLSATSTATLTNKTISGSSNTLSNVSLTTAVTGTLPVANGGTGLSSAGTNGQVLTTNGTSFSLAFPAPVTPSAVNNGLKAWTFDPSFATQNNLTVSGYAYFTAVYLQAGVTYSNVYWRVTTQGAAGSTMTWGLYNSTTQVAVTSAISTATAGNLSGSFTSAYTPTTSGVYWLGFFPSSSGTYPTVTSATGGFATFNWPLTNGTLNTLTLRGSTIGSLSSLPSVISGTPTTTNALIWLAGLA